GRTVAQDSHVLIISQVTKWASLPSVSACAHQEHRRVQWRLRERLPDDQPDGICVPELNGRKEMIRGSAAVTAALALVLLAGMTAPAGADVIATGYAESSILRYAEDGTPLPPIVPPGGMNGVLGPAGITFGPDGLLYVSNQTSAFVPGAPDSIVQIDPTTGNVTPFIPLA